MALMPRASAAPEGGCDGYPSTGRPLQFCNRAVPLFLCDPEYGPTWGLPHMRRLLAAPFLAVVLSAQAQPQLVVSVGHADAPSLDKRVTDGHRVRGLWQKLSPEPRSGHQR
jgi:hypothetical protein